MGGRSANSGLGNGKTIVTATHLTPSQNIESILRNGFDLSRAGDEGGDSWGAGVYFSTEKQVNDFYANKFKSSQGVYADIDTSNMFTVHIKGKAYSPTNMYDITANQLPQSIRKEYESALKKTTQRKALTRTLAKHYTGLIVKQTGVSGVDGTTGGNQIVVYDTNVIKKLRRKNK